MPDEKEKNIKRGATDITLLQKNGGGGYIVGHW
jgi:hypothetical protein